MRALALAALLPLPAASFELGWPVACTPGETCHIQNAFDHDPGPDAVDALCGPLTYEGHDGTDIALATLADQASGVDVLAAADGTVRGMRDGMADALQGVEGAPDVTDRECGNGVVLVHPGGWETQYCHMAEGSVAVAEGQEVRSGDVLGQVGLSGDTQFPHLHLTVRRDGVAVDPFAPGATEAADDPGLDGAVTTCGALPDADLWAGAIALPGGGVTDAGFATGVPDYTEVTAGTADRDPAPDQPLVLFALLFGGREGDVVRLAIEGPGGTVLAHEEPLERTQAQLFRAAGLRPPDGGWPAGEYRGEATLLRDGAPLDGREATVAMPGP